MNEHIEQMLLAAVAMGGSATVVVSAETEESFRSFTDRLHVMTGTEGSPYCSDDYAWVRFTFGPIGEHAVSVFAPRGSYVAKCIRSSVEQSREVAA